MTELTGIVQLGHVVAPEAAPTVAETGKFADFPLDERIIRALEDQGITQPFPIQSLTLPVALSGQDIIGQAKTGTGKTLGFGLPLLNRLEPRKDAGRTPQALVVAPTRELAAQVANDLVAAAKYLECTIVQIYGGVAFEPQTSALAAGCDVVVGTPGRMLDLMKRRQLDLTAVHTVVLDEADEMLDLGFLPDVETLLAATPASRHTMLFSATMPGAVVAMARRYMTQPTHIRAQGGTDDSATVRAVTQVVYRAHAMNKLEMLARILQAEDRGLTIVFTRTKRNAARVTEDLNERGFAAAELHGDLGQGAREQAMRAFRSGKVDVLVATDVAARGIDIDDVTHVINYQCPDDERTYLHRIGRTGRAGKAGTAVTFVDWDDTHRWMLIDKALNFNAGEPVETYHTSEHLRTDLNIPADATGRLPKSEQRRAGLDAEKLEDLGETGKRQSPRRQRSRRGGKPRDTPPRRRRNRQRRRTRGGKPTR
ncbi:MAG: DEAD/DEAH box helicase [Bowdeniella nasicola]|nr:DEAD/DEAH box helicase [Bowdeniella nasicola]